MQKIILFFRRFYPLLLFVVLQGVAIGFYANSTSYTKAKLLSSSNIFVGGAQGAIFSVRHYFGLKGENRDLAAQLAQMRELLGRYEAADSTGYQNSPVDSASAPYVYASAMVVNNSVSRQQNFFTLNRGAGDGVQEGMAVLSADGVAVGYVLATSNRFSVCMSILNTSFRSSGKIKGGDYFGSLYWEGKDTHHVTLSEVSKYAKITKGDTILTTTYSAIFPPDVMLGTVDEFALNDNGSYYVVKVRLATELSALGNVVLVRYVDAGEQQFLEQEAEANNIR